MKYLSRIILVFSVLLMVTNEAKASSVLYAPNVQAILQMEGFDQEREGWDWVACTKAVICHYTRRGGLRLFGAYDQSDIVQSVRGGVEAEKRYGMSDLDEARDALNHFGLTTTGPRIIPSFDDLIGELMYNRPVIAKVRLEQVKQKKVNLKEEPEVQKKRTEEQQKPESSKASEKTEERNFVLKTIVIYGVKRKIHNLGYMIGPLQQHERRSVNGEVSSRTLNVLYIDPVPEQSSINLRISRRYVELPYHILMYDCKGAIYTKVGRRMPGAR